MELIAGRMEMWECALHFLQHLPASIPLHIWARRVARIIRFLHLHLTHGRKHRWSAYHMPDSGLWLTTLLQQRIP